jgi:spore cortex formation protein SpoVR/YcgB (stage V sporulation)
MSNPKLDIDMSGVQVVSNDPLMRQRVRNLNILVQRVQAINDRLGLKPCRTIFVKKSDAQVLDDLVYPLGVPISRPAWYYGKAVTQQRSQGYGGHVFEFANISDPAHVVLGSTNDLVMDLDVIVHAWSGHVNIFTNNVWHGETERHSVLQWFAQNEAFVNSLTADTVNWGWDRYEYYDDAAHALENHSGEFPRNPDRISDDEHREILRHNLQDLQNAYKLANSEQDRQAIADDIRDVGRLLECHPIIPTSDILGFYADEKNSNLPEEVRRILTITRFENRYSTGVLGRTKILHEGYAHLVDAWLPREPELDLMRLGFGMFLDNAKNDVMHDAYPIYWYSDPYALGQSIMHYVRDTTMKQIGTETISFRRLDMSPEGDIIESDEIATREVPKWDMTELNRLRDSFDDFRMFDTYLTPEFFEEYLHKKALGWVNKMVMMINKVLKDVRWDPNMIFEGERFPRTLFDTYQVVTTWLNQLQLAPLVSGWLGYGAPGFPVSEASLSQMMQIVQMVAAYDEDKVAFKRNMLMRTSMFYQPNIKIVDTGRYNNAGMTTLRHEYDPDFGPLKQSHARNTLKFHWRLSGPVRLLTHEILTDATGRPWGPPRPYQYFTDNGKTVKERWLQ